MPISAIKHVVIDYTVPLAALAHLLTHLVYEKAAGPAVAKKLDG
jgi:hypothetical protein